MTTWDDEFERRGRPSAVIWAIGAVFLVFLTWAAFAWVDEIVRAQGTVVSSSRPQIIQNLEGGILAELLVAEGDTVEPGQVLGRLQGTQYQTAVDDFSDQIAALEIRKLRIEAEMRGESRFMVPRDLAGRVPDIVASEATLLKARAEDFSARKAGAQAVLDQAAKEMDILERMYAQDVAPLIEVTRARKAHSDAENRLSGTITQTELERAGDYADTLKELTSLKQNLKLAQDQLARTVLTAPMRGVVNEIAISTIGGVVRPGEEILQIIPLDEQLYVDAKVKPRDIAAVRQGQEAVVKLSAYDYTIWGSLKGEVTFVSADTFIDERSRAADGDPHYIVTLRVDLSRLTERQKKMEIRPGMQAEVELQTGGKTILTYLTKPLYKSQEAFRER
ncbi:HlyD family efflux transporter periplasmic adaptor subunit [Rhodobacter sp. SGA-6-6]|uniref:HlyD family efflux transporter periplasmic adaptor subunit n=1 Tax=Rhodobacter sp. SGA-6-6 TaxID=2710882 RepID=UPI0013EAC673|nr:HlyD family efflux transporter periplasmic adaptor subunit [Rhodobacter sp. SGA-6-6]NGM44414.1 HlyD family efflux transporter periplasmic adaptor subunit [Rhodobacter sp. SGA-6-6]